MREKGFEMIMLIKEIYSSMNCQIGSNMRTSGLTPQQILVIKLIAHNKEMTISNLCEELSLAKGTVSGIVSRLEEAGYLQKEKKKSLISAIPILLFLKKERLLHKNLEEV